MKKARDFGAVYERLRSLLARHAAGLVVRADDGKEYTLVTSKADKAGKPLYFASVRLGKAYVGYHLVPLYHNPALIEGCGDALRKRKRGKTCFDFKEIDEDRFAELSDLTDRCLAWYREAGMV